MIRRLAALALLCLSGTAHAGGYLAGGFHGAPTTSAVTGMPSLRAGFGNRGFAGYGSLGFLRGEVKQQRSDFFWVGSDANAWAAKPMIGFRPALGDADKPVVGVLDVGAYTWLWGIGGDDELDLSEQDADAGLRPIGGLVAGLGLDAEVNENLSISASMGVDFFTAGYQFDGYVYHGDLFTTWSALYVNIWL